jgi:hypothetical protein
MFSVMILYMLLLLIRNAVIYMLIEYNHIIIEVEINKVIEILDIDDITKDFPVVVNKAALL